MHLLLDENISSRIAPDLRSAGIATDYVRGADLAGASDSSVFAAALKRGCDAVVTQDRYRDLEDYVASLRAMRAGLRIFRLVFQVSHGVGASPARQLRLILSHRELLEAAVSAESTTRLLVIHEDPDRPIRVRRLDEIEAELRARRGAGVRD